MNDFSEKSSATWRESYPFARRSPREISYLVDRDVAAPEAGHAAKRLLARRAVRLRQAQVRVRVAVVRLRASIPTWRTNYAQLLLFSVSHGTIEVHLTFSGLLT